MKKCHVACVGLLLLAMASALTSCSKQEEIAIDPPWEAGEKSVYEVKKEGTVLATWELRVDPDEAGIALVSEMQGDGFREVARVKVDPRSLLPEAMSFTQETDLTRAGYTATFTTEEVIITVEPPAGSPSVPAVKLEIPEGLHFENETLLMVLRAINLGKGFEATVQDVITRTGKVATVEIKVLREETVSTVLGEIEAYVVELVGYEQLVWVAKSAPRQILKFENNVAGTVCELISYVAYSR